MQADTRRKIGRAETQQSGDFLREGFGAGEFAKLTRSALVVEQRILAHALGAAHEKDVSLAGGDFFGGLRDRLETRGAVTVHGDRGNGHGHAGAQGDHAGDVRRVDRLAHAAEDDLVDERGIDTGANEQRGGGGPPEFDGIGGRERRAHLAERGADAVDDVKRGLHG